jgi:hypothetical protein
MYSEKITFVLFMFNEEKRVERAVRNFNRHGRVLIAPASWRSASGRRS